MPNEDQQETNHDLDKRLAILTIQVAALKSDVDEMKSDIKKLLWTVGLLIVGAVFNWIIKGGLAP